MGRTVHLVCHAHIDPVWLWTWEEGLTEALCTFRIAVDFCRRHPDFVFCQNESQLYRWVEQHDPKLFSEIASLVRAGRWHVMGGAYLQPDINLPSGESHIRQFLHGIRYFVQKLGVRPRIAWNIDSFGQSEGFAQILAGSGMLGYVFSRPRPGAAPLAGPGPFRWRDRSGAEVLALRYAGSYNTRGTLAKKVAGLGELGAPDDDVLFLWGFGDHGGGPSREDYRQLRQCMKVIPELKHSTPEAYFEWVDRRRGTLPVVGGEMQNASPGCYTSMARVKRAHREAENAMAATERLAAVAWWTGRCDYPRTEIDACWRQILFAEFHDIITGTCIPSAERDTLAALAMCADTLKRARTHILLGMLGAEAPPRKQTEPVFVFNPHSFPVRTDLEFNFTHAHAPDRLGEIRFDAELGGRRLPTQRERGPLNVDHDWNLYGVCHVELPPLAIRRLDVRWQKRARPTTPRYPEVERKNLELRSRTLRVVINTRTGLVDWAGPSRESESWLGGAALKPVVFRDVSHSWMCGSPDNVKPLREGRFGPLVCPPWNKPDGFFRLASRREAARICAPSGGRREISPIRIIEDGPVRTVIEAIFVCGRSAIVRWYVFSRRVPMLEVRDRVVWNERSTMLKIEVPLSFRPEATVAETPYSAATRPVPKHHVEMSNQRWVKAVEAAGRRWVGVINSASYAHSVTGSTLYVNVLRSPPYGTSWLTAEVPEREDRYILRHDQGEHEARFGLLFGTGGSDLPLVQAAAVMNVPPAWLAHRPPGPQQRGRVTSAPPLIEIQPTTIELVALKQAEDGDGLIVRLLEHAGRRTACRLLVHRPEGKVDVCLGPYQLKTLLVRRTAQGLRFTETNLVEEPL